MKLPPETETRLEVTKDYFACGDEYINEEEGWTKTNDYISVEVEDESKED
jgi:hypothetical protein